MKLGSVIWPINVYAMLRKAFMPETNVVPARGTARTSGSPPIFFPAALMKLGSGLYPAVPCLPSAPAKAAAKITLMNVNTADAAASLERVLKVRGIEHTQEATAPIAANPTVHTACPDLSVSGEVQKCSGVFDIHTAHCVQVARDDKDMKALNESVVEQKHDCRAVPGPF